MKEIDCKSLDFNPMKEVSDHWMAVAAGDEEDYDAMTVSWGHFGSIWGHSAGRPTVVVYIRPQRHTREFIEKEGLFSVSLFDGEFKKGLSYLGTHSGNGPVKIKEAGFTPVFGEGTVYLKEAKLVFICKKIYRGKIEEAGFIDKSIIEDNYPRRDYHYVYIGEIIKTLSAE